MKTGGNVSAIFAFLSYSLGDILSVFSVLLLLSSEDALVDVGSKENLSLLSSSQPYGVDFIKICFLA